MPNQRILSIGCALLLMASLLPGALAAGDDEAASLSGVSVYGEPGFPGGKITVAADAWDQDGIDTILVRFERAGSGEILTATLREAADDAGIPEQYCGELSLPDDTLPGEYTLKSAVLTDREGQRSLYFRAGEEKHDGDLTFSFDPLPCFTVYQAVAAAAPLYCQISRDVISSPGAAALTLRATGGIPPKKASLIFENAANGRRLYLSMDVDDRIGPDTLETLLSISEYEPQGVYRLIQLTLWDEAGRKQAYGSNAGEDALPLSVSCSFSVGGGEGDCDPPTLSSIAVTHTRTDEKSRQYRVAVSAFDALSGVDHITVRFKNDQNGRSLTKILAGDDLEKGIFAGWVEVNSQEPQGTFTLDQVGLTDKTGNYQAYCRPADVSESNHKLPLPSLPAFTVATGVTAADEEAPTLLSLCVESGTARTGDTITVRAEASDDRSGTEKIKAVFQNGRGRTISVTLEPDGNAFTGKIKGYQTSQPGVYRLTRVTLTDKASNSRTYYEAPDERGELLSISALLTIEDSKEE